MKIPKNTIRCTTIRSKLRGLMFSKRKNLFFDLKRETRLGAIAHMFFVFFPIDIYWFDKNMKEVDKKEKLKPFSIAIPKKKARYILEISIKDNQ